MTRRAATIALAAGSAAVIGAVLAILLSAGAFGTGILSTNGCGPSHLLQDAGFDPWTGNPRGPIVEVDCLGHTIVEDQDVPTELVGRRGIPWATLLTVGGGLLVAGLALRWIASDERFDDKLVS